MNSTSLGLDSTPTVATAGFGRPQRILVVDDDPKVCAQLASLLKQSGNEIETAEDGEAAWAALLSTPFDLLVTDHFMPKVSGLALARRIRVAHLPVLVVLASEKLESSDTVSLSHDPWSRLDAFLHKPFTNSELLTAVRSLLPDSGTASAHSASRQPEQSACRPAGYSSGTSSASAIS